MRSCYLMGTEFLSCKKKRGLEVCCITTWMYLTTELHRKSQDVNNSSGTLLTSLSKETKYANSDQHKELDLPLILSMDFTSYFIYGFSMKMLSLYFMSNKVLLDACGKSFLALSITIRMIEVPFSDEAAACFPVNTCLNSSTVCFTQVLCRHLSSPVLSEFIGGICSTFWDSTPRDLNHSIWGGAWHLCF